MPKIFDGNEYRYMTPQEEQEYKKSQQETEYPEYDEIVVHLIRNGIDGHKGYSLDDELAIQRQKDTKPDEWEEYNAFCEECKSKAKEIIEKR